MVINIKNGLILNDIFIYIIYIYIYIQYNLVFVDQTKNNKREKGMSLYYTKAKVVKIDNSANVIIQILKA